MGWILINALAIGTGLFTVKVAIEAKYTGLLILNSMVLALNVGVLLFNIGRLIGRLY
jgi:hypothetical protein